MLNWCRGGGSSCHLCALRAERAALAALADFGTERHDRPQSACPAKRACRASYSARQPGREEKFTQRSCCAGEGRCPFLCVPRPQREFPCCQGAREKMLPETTAAAPGTVPLCTQSPQASSAGSEGGCALLCTKPAGRVQFPCHHCLCVLLLQPTFRAGEVRGGGGEGVLP